MWTLRTDQLGNGRVIRVTLDSESATVSYGEVLQRWQDDVDFRTLFSRTLADAPFAAFRWETPAITTATASRPFEFVLVDSPELRNRADPRAFAEHFSDGDEAGVVEFPNLGNNAILVVPCPQGPVSAYGHVGAFVRDAPEMQIHELWKSVGAAMQRRLSNKPVWLSTAGAGVPWLHVRLDDRPKYYNYSPYRSVV